MTSATSIYEKAQEAYDWFETAERQEVESITRLKEGAPEWVTELVYRAHGEFLPDDWRYVAIRAALGDIADNEPDDLDEYAAEWADGHVDVYNAARVQWLASNLNRAAYCDEAAAEFGLDEERGIFHLIGLGQYMEASEVYASIAESLTDA
jgi:hypothetical protein